MLGEPQRGGYGAPGASPIRFADQAALDATMREFGDDRSGVDWYFFAYRLNLVVTSLTADLPGYSLIIRATMC